MTIQQPRLPEEVWDRGVPILVEDGIRAALSYAYHTGAVRALERLRHQAEFRRDEVWSNVPQSRRDDPYLHGRADSYAWALEAITSRLPEHRQNLEKP